MLMSLIVRLVASSVRRPIWVVALSLVLAAASSVYIAGHFRINTDISTLIENDPQWSALGDAIDRAFPQRGQTVLAVVEAPRPNSPTPRPTRSRPGSKRQRMRARWAMSRNRAAARSSNTTACCSSPPAR